ncbi:MAG TPA: A/G-specific adenine glycosylase [Capsulimonadaceae bacterium]
MKETQEFQGNELPDDFAPTLLAWYDTAARDLPWREREDDAYAVWISEIMLQQTTVSTVIPYYNRWMETLPTVESLATAEMEAVLSLWAGLGYYSRARNIKRTAEIVCETHGGELPRTVDGLSKLPGIGRYTAGAISSIAYGERAPVLDGNVMRVYSRLLADSTDIDSTKGIAQLWAVAEAQLPEARVGDFNQALMELGATVCLPSTPKCGACPVRPFCRAYEAGEPQMYPVRSRKTRWIDVVDCAAAIERDGRLLVVKRPEGGVWASLWELPRATLLDGETRPECARRAAVESVGLDVVVGDAVGTVKHVVMNRRIALTCFEAAGDGDPVAVLGRAVEVRWVSDEDTDGMPFPAPQQKVIELWRKRGKQRRLSL